ncbi:hypothetical protein KH5H1_39190 [Corallococcus caeni]|uniref:Uncharacterized protein n=1 Tax=Corallococcus caeni TaxID=3082388 RepID=A0ABQ6QY28_9BACT|nr:hypothetical protein KH5H1_39190 [Corallococcus sp. KH5-1]GMU08950.1 hypothetical protein ASNO1_52030 [Corallococcus sp. NO1]
MRAAVSRTSVLLPGTVSSGRTFTIAPSPHTAGPAANTGKAMDNDNNNPRPHCRIPSMGNEWARTVNSSTRPG